MKVRLFTVSNEIQASIVKGVLESADILSFIIPAKDNLPAIHVMNGTSFRYDVLVEDDMIEKATLVLKENGWISDGGSSKSKKIYNIIFIIIMIMIIVAVVEYFSFVLIQKIIGYA